MTTGAKRDLVIVGGGPAGLATALFVRHHAPDLAARTVVLEKARYPRDKYCAGAIAARGVRILDHIGVRVDVPAVPIDTMSLKLPHRTLRVTDGGLAIVVRRLEHDHALAREVIARGIELREGCPVARVEPVADGARVHLESGETIEARAVVGADGVSGVVRKSAGFARARLRAQVVEVDTEIADGDPPFDTLHFDLTDRSLRGYVWDFPTLVGGRRMMCRGVYAITERGEPSRVRERLRTYLAHKGLRAEAYRFKQLAERGFEPGRRISRPNVMLVGEAAGIDIATGEGIAQALELGELAGAYLARAFRSGDLRFADWLGTVQRARAGQRLVFRYGAYVAFYGSERAAVEQILGAGPDVIRVLAQSFAGKPTPFSAAARMTRQLTSPTARVAPGIAWRVLRSLRKET